MAVPASDSRSVRRTGMLALIIGVAVILRVGSAVYYGSTIEALPGVADQISYHELALRVANGHGFSFETNWWPATRANEPTAHWSYLYVLFLAAVYSVAGPAPLVARIVQAVIVGILHPLLMWRIGRRLFSPAVGLVSAGLAAVYGYFAYYGGALVTESFYIVAFLWVIDLATALALKRDGWKQWRVGPWLLFGLALGVGALLRQVFLLVVPIILAWMAWMLLRDGEDGSPIGRALTVGGRMAVAMAVLLACVLPWTVRNYYAFGQFVPLNTNAGFVFFWGNHPIHGSRFIPILPNDPTVNYMTLLPREFRRLDEAALDRALLQRGLEFVRADPARYVQLSLSRAEEYFRVLPSPDSSVASNVVRLASFGPLLPLVIGGMLLTVARRGTMNREAMAGMLLLVAVAGAYSLVHLLTWTLVRYRLPVDALVMPFAGVTLTLLHQRLLKRAAPVEASVPGSVR